MRKTNLVPIGIALAMAASGHAVAQSAAAPVVAASAVAAAPAVQALPVVQKPVQVSSIRKDNISTVDELLKIENEKAKSQARKEVQAMGLGSESKTDVAAFKKSVPIVLPATLYVESISGVSSQLSAYLSYNGQRYESVRPGAPVGPCTISTISGARVTLAQTSKKTKANQCPSASWTGAPNPFEFAAAMNVERNNAPPGALTPMPMPMPLPPGAIPTNAARAGNR